MVRRALPAFLFAVATAACGGESSSLLPCDLAEGEVPVRFEVRVFEGDGAACTASDTSVSGTGTLRLGEPHELDYEWDGASGTVRSDTTVSAPTGERAALRCTEMGGWDATLPGPCPDVIFGIEAR
ncbi:MAG TPA: hypothetical protein RMH99_11290 [Sandaracinaceae bacterium LLY-WYZ-13_1]|nr:hypothetical protein [Sandaracinaceae bacterium LLY-WYZ-13_1]